jgi:hypothetical protein
MIMDLLDSATIGVDLIGAVPCLTVNNIVSYPARQPARAYHLLQLLPPYSESLWVQMGSPYYSAYTISVHCHNEDVSSGYFYVDTGL